MKTLLQIFQTIVFFAYVGIICIIFSLAFFFLLLWVFSLPAFWEVTVLLVVFAGVWKWLSEVLDFLIFWAVFKLNGFIGAMKAILITCGLTMTMCFIYFPWAGVMRPEPNVIEKVLTGFLGIGFIASFYTMSALLNIKSGFVNNEEYL